MCDFVSLLVQFYTYDAPNLQQSIIIMLMVRAAILYCVQTIQGTVRLFIEVEDYDIFNSDNHIDDIYVTITLTPSSSFTSRRAYTGIHGNSRIELSFRVQCRSSFYGSNCATRCVARDYSGGTLQLWDEWTEDMLKRMEWTI